jgi:penicillin-binding protein 1A
VQTYGSGRRPQGASTITQQVAKNFLLTNEVSLPRKIKEALLSLKIERAYSKEKILELYLNEIYLGFSSYGIAAASLLYFDKSVNELTIAEAAYLAALPKGPNNYHPFRQRDNAIGRRNYVIDRMVEERFVTAQEGENAKKEPLKVTQRPTGAHIFAAEYFAEEVRRYIYDNYGEKKLYEGGLSVRGDMANPAPYGRFDILSGGKVFLQTREFAVIVLAAELVGSFGGILVFSLPGLVRTLCHSHSLLLPVLCLHHAPVCLLKTEGLNEIGWPEGVSSPSRRVSSGARLRYKISGPASDKVGYGITCGGNPP